MDLHSTKRSSLPSRQSSYDWTMSEANSSGGMDSIAESLMNASGGDWIEKCVVTAFQFDECNSASADLNVDLEDVATDDEVGTEEQVAEVAGEDFASAKITYIDDYMSGK